MTLTSLEKMAEGQYKVHGEITFHTISSLLAQSSPLFGTTKDICFDLSTVTQSDSAGLALLIEWLRSAHKTDMTINFTNIPPQLNSIAKVCGLDKIL